MAGDVVGAKTGTNLAHLLFHLSFHPLLAVTSFLPRRQAGLGVDAVVPIIIQLGAQRCVGQLAHLRPQQADRQRNLDWGAAVTIGNDSGEVDAPTGDVDGAGVDG